MAFVLLIGVVTGAELFTSTGSFIGSCGWLRSIGAAGIDRSLLGLIAFFGLKVFNDPMIEITVVLVTSYAVFFICEHFHVSGVLGLRIGDRMAGIGRTRQSGIHHARILGTGCLRCKCDYLHCCRCGYCSKCQSDRMDFAILGLVYLAFMWFVR